MAQHKPQVIAISSGKGGVGKTTLAVNLGIALSRLGVRVCLFDADTNLANINIMLRQVPEYTLQHVLDAEKKLADVILNVHGISYIPGASGVTNYTELTAQQQKQLIMGLSQLEQAYDVILVDTSAGIHDNVLNFIEAAHQSLVVITPEPTSLTDSFSLLRMLRKRRYRKPINIVVNQADSELGARQVYKRFSAAVERYIGYQPDYLGYVSHDELVSSAICSQVPVRVYRASSAASVCYDQLAQSLAECLQNATDKPGLSQQILHRVRKSRGSLKARQSSPTVLASDTTPSVEGSDQQRLYQHADRVRKKQLVLEHKQSIIEFIDDADYSQEEISGMLEEFQSVFSKRFKTYPHDPLEQVNHQLQQNSLGQERINQLFSELLLFYKNHSSQVDRDSMAELINHQINDYVNEYGSYPFDTSQALMQSIGMGQVTDEAIMELDTMLNLVGHSGPLRNRDDSQPLYATENPHEREEILQQLKQQSEQIKTTGSSQRGLVDSILFASKLTS